ncbi:MAG: hypothetical protein ACI4XA_10120 [Oscillospiraceae bacterium]
MSVLKRNSVCYGGGVDISNKVELRRQDTAKAHGDAAPNAAVPDSSEQLAERERRVADLEEQLNAQRKELELLKEHYINQGKEVIIEAKRRAEGILAAAQQNAAEITADAESRREGVFIKAKAEGFEQGRKDGVDACLAEGRDILNEAKAYSERIMSEKAALFDRYEKDIFDTVMDIANKVTLGSMSVKDGTAARKLIKKAAKEFRSSQTVRITLDKNGASEEIAGDAEYLKELCGGAEHVEVELLPDAEPGTVIVDNGSEITDAGIQTQLRMIRELGSGKFRRGNDSSEEE